MTAAVQLITDNLDIWSSAVQTKSAAGRGGSKKLELHGIKKLRELILDLAVRGLLVPQDPDDEPASELLRKIADEKARLVKDGRIRKQKALRAIEEKEKPFALPSGWEWAFLGELSSDIHYGYTASAKPDNEGIRLLRITDIQGDKVDWRTVPGCEISEANSEKYLLEENDILIARTGGTIGKSYLVENIDLKAVFASYLIRVKRITAMYSPYIKTFLGSAVYWTQLYANASGTGQPNVNATALKQLVVPIPTIEAQHRIVAKVDELMALCDQLEQQQETSITAHQTLVQTLLDALTTASEREDFTAAWARIADHLDTLFTTEWSIDQLKQTILQLAVMGKLVPQDPNDEPASELLKNIAAKKAKLVKDGKVKKQAELLAIDDDEKPAVRPKGWAYCRLGDAIRVINGRAYKKHEMLSEGTPLLRVGNLFTSNEWYYSNLELEPDKYIDTGDLIYAWSASFGPFIWGGDKVIYHYHIWKLDFYDPKNLYKYYVHHYLQAITEAIKASGHGIAMLHMTKERMEKLVVPVPPIAEQRRIVAKVDELMTLCDTLKTRLNTAQTTRRQLADAMAEQAIG